MRKQLAKLFGCAECDVDEVVKSDAAARRVLDRRGFLGAALALAASPVAPEPENLVRVERTPEIWTEDFHFKFEGKGSVDFPFLATGICVVAIGEGSWFEMRVP